MKRNRTYLARLGALVLAAAMLTGCAGQPGGSTEGTAGITADVKTGAGTAQGENLPVDESGNPDPLGRYQEPVSLKIAQTVNPTIPFPEGQTATDNAFFDYLKEAMNIEVEVMWQAGSADDYNEKLNLAISSGELPDLFSVDGPQLKMLMASGMLEDITEGYEIYASDRVKMAIDSTEGKAMEAVSYDGAMMALPNVKAMKDGYDLLWIRQDWLEELGLEVPKTIDEIRTTAKAFIDHRMGGDKTIGLLSPSSGSSLYANFLKSSAVMCGLGGIFQANRAFPGYWIKDENGDTVYGSLTQETKETLQILADMYQEGTLDPELGTRKDADEAWKSGRAGMFFGPWWVGYNLKDALANDPGADWQAYPYPLTEDGKWSAHMMNPSDTFCVIRKGYEHPEILILMNNYYQRDAAKVDTMGVDLGLLPARLLLNTAKQKESDAEILKKYLETDTVPDYDKDEHNLMQNDLDTVKGAKLEPYDDYGIRNWNIEDANFPRLYSILVGVGAIDKGYETGCEETYSDLYWQTDSMQRKWSNLQKLEDEMFLKMILGTVSIDEFDQFAADWESQGGADITKEVREAVHK